MDPFPFENFDAVLALGRLHPFVLHLPIGIFAALAFLLLVGGRGEKPGLRRAHGALVFLLVATTPLAAATGWLLAEEGGYGEPVDLHRWLGIGTGALSLALGLAFVLRAKLYAPLVWLGLGLLFPTGHFGAVLTHGEGFLLDPWFGGAPAERAGVAANAGEVRPVTFAEVSPVLDRLCGRCHGEQRQKGGLSLHTRALAEAGGSSGPAVILGDPEGSVLLRRVSLPLDHAAHMPPAEKPQPTPEEIALLRAWIAGEAVSAPAGVTSEPSEPEPRDARAEEREPAELERAVAALRGRLVHVQRQAEGGDELWIDFASATLAPGELEVLLRPLAPDVVELSLARQPVDVADLAYAASLPRLERLDLRALPGGPHALDELRAAGALRVLNLAGTSVDPSAEEILCSLPQLERLFIWESGLDAESLRTARPELEVHAASPAPDEPVEVEREVVFTRDGETPPEPGGLAVPRPINANCPVTGSPIDPRYVILYEGNAIAFCCPNCPRTFWEDPAPFLAGLVEAGGSAGD